MPADTARRRPLTMLAASLALFTTFLDDLSRQHGHQRRPAVDQRGVGAAPDALEWIVNACIVVFASLILLGGKLGDRYGRKRLFLAGLTVFGAKRHTTAVGRQTKKQVWL
jgi:MFS family permease